MKFIIYKNPVILAIIINTIYLILFIYSISGREREGWLAVAIFMSIFIVGSINRKIISKGQGINTKQKIAIWIIFYSTIVIAVLYSIFM